jgi:hypothetical protein
MHSKGCFFNAYTKAERIDTMLYFEPFRLPYLDTPDDLGGGENEDLKPDEKPAEGEEVKEEPKEEPAEEFDEILYNKEPVKLSAKDRQKYLQLGYHLENKVQGKLTELERDNQRKEDFAKRLGFSSFDELETAQAQRELEEQAEQYATEKGMDTETAMRLIQLEKKDAEREAAEKKRVRDFNNNTQREAVKSDPLFNELDALVQKTLAMPEMANESYQNVYTYVCGMPDNRNRIIEEAKKLAEQRAIANIHDKKSRGLTDSSDGEPDEDVELTPEGKTMAAAFGNDPREIAKYVKKQIRR